MQERSYTLPMCSIGRATHVPSSLVNVSVDTHSSLPTKSNEIETNTESSTSTPELNLLLDKLTEILRFRSGCRRHFGVIQQQKKDVSPSPSSANLKRLQSSIIEPLHNTNDISSMTLDNSSISTGAWKSTNLHNKSSVSNRFQHHHNKYHINLPNHINNFEKKRHLPSLLQRLIDEGNLIKEAVRRLKTQRFSQTFKLQEKQNILNTPSPPTKKSSIQNQTNYMPRLTSSSSINLTRSQQLNDSPIQMTSSPNRGISWFLSSSVFGANSSTTNHSSGSGSPLRTCYLSASTHDRTPMEISIQDT